MGKRKHITIQTKQNLIDAFWELYCEKRIEKITVKDITNKAGYNRSTFYDYFSDSYEVLDYIEQTLIPTIDELPYINTPFGDLGMPFEHCINLFEKNQKYYTVLLGPNGDPAFINKIKDAIKPVLINELIKHVKMDSITLDYILEYILISMIGIMHYWYNQKNPISKKEMYELIKKIMDEGIYKQLFQI